MTTGLRDLLAPAGTLVTGLHMGFTDTSMVAGYDVPENDPRDVARAAVQGLVDDVTEVLVEEATRAVKAALSGEPQHLGATVQTSSPPRRGASSCCRGQTCSCSAATSAASEDDLTSASAAASSITRRAEVRSTACITGGLVAADGQPVVAGFSRPAAVRGRATEGSCAGRPPG